MSAKIFLSEVLFTETETLFNTADSKVSLTDLQIVTVKDVAPASSKSAENSGKKETEDSVYDLRFFNLTHFSKNLFTSKVMSVISLLFLLVSLPKTMQIEIPNDLK